MTINLENDKRKICYNCEHFMFGDNIKFPYCVLTNKKVNKHKTCKKFLTCIDPLKGALI